LKDQGVDGKMGLEWMREIACGGVEWIHLAQDRGWWQDLINEAMNLRVLVPHSYK
jgi:hypothetical protein